MKSIFKTIFVLAALTSPITTASAAGMNDLKVEFTVIVRKDEATTFRYDIEHSGKYDSNCTFVPYDNKKHKLFKKLRPASGAGRKDYVILRYECAPAVTKYYELFNETAVDYAKKYTDYYVRLLVDTVNDPDSACIRKLCAADGLYHKTPNPPGNACAYCP